MGKITSFITDHNKLQSGVYVSKEDQVEGGTVTTFDLGMTSPNEKPMMDIAGIHTIEHPGATLLGNHGTSDKKCACFGPIGCRTGFCLLLTGDYESTDILPLMAETCEFIRDFEGEVPGTSPENYDGHLNMNSGMVRFLAGKYPGVPYHVDQLPESRLVYPR